jgi:hypothetical protein
VRWLADENFDNDIVRGLLKKAPSFDILRVQDVGLGERDDGEILVWATRSDRVLLTHDLSTMIPAMRRQFEQTSRCSPIMFVPDWMPIGQAIEEILLWDVCSVESDWVAGVIYLPLR